MTLTLKLQLIAWTGPAVVVLLLSFCCIPVVFLLSFCCIDPVEVLSQLA